MGSLWPADENRRHLWDKWGGLPARPRRLPQLWPLLTGRWFLSTSLNAQHLHNVTRRPGNGFSGAASILFMAGSGVPVTLHFSANLLWSARIRRFRVTSHAALFPPERSMTASHLATDMRRWCQNTNNLSAFSDYSQFVSLPGCLMRLHRLSCVLHIELPYNINLTVSLTNSKSYSQIHNAIWQPSKIQFELNWIYEVLV